MCTLTNNFCEHVSAVMVKTVKGTAVVVVVMTVVMAAIFAVMKENDTGISLIVSNKHYVEVGKFVERRFLHLWQLELAMLTTLQISENCANFFLNTYICSYFYKILLFLFLNSFTDLVGAVWHNYL